MNQFQLYALTESGCQALPLPANVTDVDDLYQGLALGVYSVLRTFEHDKFLKLDEHLRRSQQSMALIGWDEPLDEPALRRGIHEACTASPWPEMRVRYDILAEPARSLGTDSRLLIALMPLKVPTPDQYRRGVCLGLAPNLKRQQPLAKTAGFTRERRTALPQRPAVEDYLLLDESGNLLEGTSSNFYGIRQETVWTAGRGVLEGITRQAILDLLPQLGISLSLEPIPLKELDTLEEAAISSSSRGFLPAVKIGGQVVGSGHPGPISRRILAAYNDYVARHIKTAI